MRQFTASIAILYLLFNAYPSQACNCMSKPQLDARDWNDAEIILQVEILNVEASEDVGRLTFETINSYKGPNPGPEASVNYYLDECHTMSDDLADIAKDQQWILFIEVRDSALRLKESVNEEYCALSRRISNADSEATLAFLADMRDGSTGPAELFYPNGALMASGEYEMGVATGIWKYYDYSGNVLEQGEYLDGRRDGQWDRFKLNYANGRQYVTASDFYTEGRLDAFEEYNQRGMVQIRHEFKEHGQRRSTYFNEDGLADHVKITHPLSRTEVLITYYADGKIREVSYLEDGLPMETPKYAETIQTILGGLPDRDLISNIE